MKITAFEKMKNGNVKAITGKGTYEIAKDADYGTPYAICLPDTDTFIPINKGTGKRIYNQILKTIERCPNFPVKQN